MFASGGSWEQQVAKFSKFSQCCWRPAGWWRGGAAPGHRERRAKVSAGWKVGQCSAYSCTAAVQCTAVHTPGIFAVQFIKKQLC